MSNPSLLCVPYRFKTSKLYSQIPDSGLGDFTVTRSASNSATRVNAAGLIETVADNVPRLDYPLGGITAGCPALLVEPAATNLAFNSQTWASANNWGLDGVTIATATSGTTAPDGTSTANAISPTSGNVAHICYSNQPTLITFVSGTIYTQSAFFKQGTGVAGRYVQLTFGGSRFAQAGYANFDLQVGAVTAIGGTADPNRNARIENYGNGWYRCSFTATCTSNGTTNGVDPILINASGMTRSQAVLGFPGTVTDVLYGWGAQLETGSLATSYIPTAASTVTRGAETISKTGVSSLIGQTEGTMYAEVDVRNRLNGTAVLTLAKDAGVSSRVIIYTNTNNQWRANYTDASGTIVDTSAANNTQVLGINKLALAYGAGGNATLHCNGSLIITLPGTSAFVQDLQAIFLGSSNAGALFFNNRILAAELYPTRLTNAQLQSLTQ